MSRAAAVSTHADASEASREVLGHGGTALKAVLSGFFAAAGAAPGVIFGPATILVGGIGTGVRVFDGRCRQPGLEGRRPRGFLSEEEVPLSARIAVPGAIWAAAVAGGYHQGASLTACVRPGVTRAKKAGAEGRARLLDHIASHGPRTFLQAGVRQAWLTQFGAVEGGLVQPKDLEPRTELDAESASYTDGLGPSWSGEDCSRANLGQEHAVLAIDGAGMFVAMSFRELPDEVRLDGFDAAVPLLAEPVMRGVPRVAPGVALPSGARLRLAFAQGRVEAVRALAGDQLLELYRDHHSREVTINAPGMLL